MSKKKKKSKTCFADNRKGKATAYLRILKDGTRIPVAVKEIIPKEYLPDTFWIEFDESHL